MSEIRKYFDQKNNGNMIYPHLWNAANSVPRGKRITLNTFMKKEGKLKICIIAPKSKKE